MNGVETSVRRALAAHFVYLDELLAKTQAACGVARTSRLFYRYELDVPQAGLAAVLEGVARFRRQLDTFGSRWGLDLPAEKVLSSHALAVDLQFLDIALEEMSPSSLSGYGPLGDDFVLDYELLQQALRAEIGTITEALAQRPRAGT
ncbi:MULTISPECIES: hypothetical protein [Burkholderiaceae]|jgi:hypothetical protein|uniref:Uncharacterized protein n=1 Tax=Burkholderia vietnamiensis TaxID=60552 RepID=A0AAW7TF66_BURVI|nr:MULTISPECIES: hypothetical protein [Burkholderiaceae]MDN7799428.1 hypothetical protein [Burkholderia vietnamiensis]RFU44265.1 hypothetical protein D0B32_28945 [Paraburkholderia sp. DHOC27]